MSSPNATAPLDSLLAVYYRTECDALGFELPVDLRAAALPDLGTAVERLTSRITGPPGNPGAQTTAELVANGVARLCFAQLSRRAFVADGRNARIVDALRGMWDKYAALGYTSPRGFDDLIEQLEGLRSADAQFAAAASSGMFAPITTHPIRNFWSQAVYQGRVTDVTAHAEVDRPFMEFTRILDPRRWAETFPDVWVDAKMLDEAPTNREEDGTERADQTQPLDSGLLFEKAIYPSRTLQLCEFRNLLDVDIDLRGQNDRIGFTFRERECLTSRLLLQTFPGGIDVDSGYAWASKLTPGSSSLIARKRARFSQPRGFLNDTYNRMAFVSLRLFIESCVLVGSQL